MTDSEIKPRTDACVAAIGSASDALDRPLQQSQQKTEQTAHHGEGEQDQADDDDQDIEHRGRRIAFQMQSSSPNNLLYQKCRDRALDPRMH